MSNTIYALLVGIDQYPAPINQLRGCVNDIQRVKTMLEQRIAGDGKRFDPVVLTNEQATRRALIDGFRAHLGKAGKDDVALFYYSGHGSQAPSPPEFWQLEPDKLDETLVCWDSRMAGNWDLADKELAQLISEISAKNPHIIIILDCCHSGSGTRTFAEGVRTRRAPTDSRQRPIESFIVTPAQASAAQQGVTRRALQAPGDWLQWPEGRYVVYSACSAAEEAKELALGGEQRGAFSYYLLDTLQQASASLSYRELFKRVNALVRAKVSQQSPQMEATDLDYVNMPFLGGAIAAGNPYYTLSHDKERGWVIDGGAVHGIPTPTVQETTLLALFPFDTPTTNLRDMKRTIGEAWVAAIFPAQSTVTATLTDGGRLDPNMTYKAVVIALPLPPLVVAVEGDEAALALVRTALASAGADGGPSRLVQTGDKEKAELRLIAEENRYRIRRMADAYALVVDTPDFTSDSAAVIVQRLEHIARWTKIVELTNKHSQLAPNAVQLAILRVDRNGKETPVEVGSEVRLTYEFNDGRWRNPRFKVKLTNTSERRLYCMLFDLNETYGVDPSWLLGGGVWLAPGEMAWALGGKPLYAGVPDALWKAGVIEIKDVLKLIVSTDESDATLLAQPELPVTVVQTKGATRSFNRLNTLNRLMYRVQTRSFSTQPDDDEVLADWMTAEVSFTTVRPQAAVEIQAAQPTPLIPGVTVQGPANLKAKARLTTLAEASRDLGNLALPALLRDQAASEPLEFTTSRSGAPGLSVLELFDIENPDTVTPTQPLVVQTDMALGEDEHWLAVGFDGEFYLPLGYAHKNAAGTEIITLERLPDPTSAGKRSLTGSIKIFFQKVLKY